MSGDGWIVLQLHDSLCAQGDHVSTHTTLEGAKSAAAAAGCIFINESSGNKFSVRAVDDPQHAILVPSPGGPWKVHARIPSNPVGVKLLLDLPPAPSSPVATRVDNSESGLRGRLDAALAEGDFMEAATISAQLTSRHEEQHGPIELGIEEQDAEDAALAALARARLEDAMERAANPDTKTQSVMINWKREPEERLAPDRTPMALELVRLSAVKATLQAPPPPTRSVGVSDENAELVLRSEELRAKLAEVERQRAMTTTGGLRSRMLDEEADAADAVRAALKAQQAAKEQDGRSVMQLQLAELDARKAQLVSEHEEKVAASKPESVSLLDVHCDAIAAQLEADNTRQRVTVVADKLDALADALADKADAERLKARAASEAEGVSVLASIISKTEETKRQLLAQQAAQEAAAQSATQASGKSVLDVACDGAAVALAEADAIKRASTTDQTTAQLLLDADLDAMDAVRAASKAKEAAGTESTLARTVAEQETAKAALEAELSREEAHAARAKEQRSLVQVQCDETMAALTAAELNTRAGEVGATKADALADALADRDDLKRMQARAKAVAEGEDNVMAAAVKEKAAQLQALAAAPALNPARIKLTDVAQASLEEVELEIKSQEKQAHYEAESAAHEIALSGMNAIVNAECE